LIALLVLVASAFPPALGQQRHNNSSQSPEKKTISMDFDQVDIKVFIKFISELTGRNFVVDNKVRGKVTVLSPSKISLNEAYKVFESVLEIHGFTTVPAGKVIKVVPSVAARQKSVELRKSPGFVSRPDDRVITQIVPLLYADSQQVRKVLAPLVSKRGVIIAYNPTDMLIITDFQSNIQRLVQIIEEIDVESGESTISVMPLEYASAEKLARTITQLVETRLKGRKTRRARRATTAPLKIVPDERINVLITLADRQQTLMIENLIETLDQPTPKGAGNIQVVYLENAEAEELAKVLSGLPEKGAKKPGAKQPIISTEVKIVADKATNSLVITAKAEEFQVLQPIIEKLDIPRKQVFVEALIMEISTTESLSIGVDWTVGDQTTIRSRDGVVFGGSNTGGISLVDEAGNLSLPSGMTLGAIAFPFNFSFGGTQIVVDSLTALVNAAETHDEFKIISTPQLMTLDNEEATVVVAENIPFSTRVDAGTAVTDRAIQSFEYRDVGTTLKITPQINEKRFVQLKIYQEVSRVVNESVQTGIDQVVLAPTTRKRTAETNVAVKDGQTVVIAGLIGEDSDSTQTGVPCLGDVPLLGWLFKSRDTQDRYTNLLVFLTPHIVASPEEADRLYDEKYRFMEELKQGYEEFDEPVKVPDYEPAQEPPPEPTEEPTAAVGSKLASTTQQALGTRC
jgi:general secretion pathway protein D